MKARFYSFFSCLLVLLQLQQAKAQDIHFSQFYEASMLRNPALTGLFNGDYRMGVLYRNQWSSISAPFQTGMASAEFKKQIGSSQDYLAIAFQGFYDRSGSINLSTMSGSLAMSYNKMLQEEHSTLFSFGLMGGYIQRNYDPSRMTFSDQYLLGYGYDPHNPSGENLPNPKVGQMDFGLGLNLSSNTGADNQNNYRIGLGVYHLTRPETNFYNQYVGIKQELRWNLNMSGNWILDDYWSAQVQANFMLQGQYKEFIAGGLVGYKKDDPNGLNTLVYYGGLLYRVGDALIPVVKIDYNDLTFGFSYDMNISKLRTASNLRGGFEVSIIKTGLFGDPNKGMSSMVCPRR